MTTFKKLKIGAVFTPIEWGEFAVSKFDIFNKWIAGASVFDPTMGNGKLQEALISYGLKQGYKLKDLPVKNLFGNELNTEHYNESLNLFREKYGQDMSRNFTNQDFLELKQKQYDIIFGNPPWTNFVDLPESYKQKLKPEFVKYQLIENRKNVLLGNSRIDVAALIIQKAIKEFLVRGGQAYFFMPLSLLLNEGANKNFRKYKIDEADFALRTVYDFNDSDVFNGIGTRYGLVHFTRDKKTSFPIAYHCFEKNNWKQYKAKPIFNLTDPLSVLKEKELSLMDKFSPITITKKSTPRQGINTSGANSVFFFNQCEKQNDEDYLMNGKYIIPQKYIYPLLTLRNFKEKELEPYKWVLLPYNENGKPLSASEMEKEHLLFTYLKKFEKQLKSRKGQMINAHLKRGIWWALLGVGPYNFTEYKIVWESYGRKTFRPMIVDGNWQANQSLQAFIPTENKTEANRILNELQNPLIEKYLLSLRMEGTMSWAQPGIIKKLLKIT